MQIGDEVYVHGYVDEIRKDVVIIRNEGGYFGTVAQEVKAQQTETEECENDHVCGLCDKTDCAWT